MIILAGACLLGGAGQAFGWGPGTHMGLGASVLERLPLLPAMVASILARHGIAYLYGNIAADMVFAKRWSRIKQFCHHWSTAFGLLDTAQDEQTKAFAYGYLSHLAADTVAHGKYVPRQIILSQCSVNFGHFFWELRADAMEDAQTWRLFEEVLRDDHACHHRVLAGHINGTFLPHDLNRVVFDRMNALAMREGLRRSVDVWNRCSRWYLSRELVGGYQAESLNRIHSILTQGPRSPLLREDPNGTSSLMHVRVHRRDVRRLKRRGMPVKRRVSEASRGLTPRPVAESLTAELTHPAIAVSDDLTQRGVVLQA